MKQEERAISSRSFEVHTWKQPSLMRYKKQVAVKEKKKKKAKNLDSRRRKANDSSLVIITLQQFQRRLENDQGMFSTG